MRYRVPPEPEWFERRVLKQFAWLPVVIKSEGWEYVVWLEHYWQVQEYNTHRHWGNKEKYFKEKTYEL